MASLRQDVPPPAIYNGLPHIREVVSVPQDDMESLEMLRSLLAKHDVPDSISIRLIHKHFDINQGEAVMIKTLDIPEYGNVSVLRPTKTSDRRTLTGLHFFVDEEGHLQAYEYCSSPKTDVSGLESFFREFCQTVMKHGLREKFGLKICDKSADVAGWTEFEFAEHRRTIMIPPGLPTPPGDFDVVVETEFHTRLGESGSAKCHHTSKKVCAHCRHCSHGKKRAEESEIHDLIVGGQLTEACSAFEDFYRVVQELW